MFIDERSTVVSFGKFGILLLEPLISNAMNLVVTWPDE